MLAPPPAAADGAACAGGDTWQGAAGETAGNAAQLAGMDESMQALREVVVWPIKYAKEAAALGLKWPSGVLLYGPPGTGKRSHSQPAASHLTSRSPPSLPSFLPFSLPSSLPSSLPFSLPSSPPSSLPSSLPAFPQLHARSLPLHADVDMRQLAARCKGYVGADLAAVCREAALAAVMEMAAGEDERGGEAFSGGVGIVAEGGEGVCGEREGALAAVMMEMAAGKVQAVSGEEESGEKEAMGENRTEVWERERGERREGGGAERLDGSSSSSSSSGLTQESSGGSSNSCMTSSIGSNAYQAKRSTATASDTSNTARSKLKTSQASQQGLVCMKHFEAALSRVGPSVTRGVAAELPAVTWNDIGGLEGVKKRLQMAVEWPLQHPEAFQRLALTPPRGVLLHGPPGGGKTLLALAAAHASKATLFSLSGADLFSMYVGEGEAMLKDTFRLARMAAPSVVFVDEVDVVGGRRSDAESSGSGGGGGRGGGGGGGGSVGERLLAALLTEMDGLQSLTAPITHSSTTSRTSSGTESSSMSSTGSTSQGKSNDASAPSSSSSSSSSVLVIAATNRFQALDPAIIRPGRFDSIIYVPPLDEPGRLHALQICTAAMRLAADISLPAVATRTAMFTGADVAALCREAALAALRGKVLGNGEGGSETTPEDTAQGEAKAEAEAGTEAHGAAAAAVVASNTSPPCVCQEHFDAALMVVRPSLTELEVRAYERDT
ncbi:unnamed protein product [Closterium sp. NIES-54]